eukprot:scaffold28915_cov29-Tisochrysis_lutea.AAC.5
MGRVARAASAARRAVSATHASTSADSNIFESAEVTGSSRVITRMRRSPHVVAGTRVSQLVFLMRDLDRKALVLVDVWQGEQVDAADEEVAMEGGDA